jgi:pimeloyl-ACP methyl ester carboxylesterase
MVVFLTDYLQLGSKKIEIQWHPDGDKDFPTLIFLHEGLGCTRMWKDFPEKLSRMTNCPGLVFSRLGYGKSDSSPLPWKINFMHEQALKILPWIIRKAQIKRYILIGHSDGGSIGTIFSGSPKVKSSRGLMGLITEAAHVFCEQITVDCIQQAKINYEHHNLKQGLEKYHGSNTENAFRGWNDIWLNPKFMFWNIEKYLSKIKIPMLAIQGENDQYGTKKQIESIKHNVTNIETHLLDNCRHAPHLDQPEIVLNLMSQFIYQIIE